MTLHLLSEPGSLVLLKEGAVYIGSLCQVAVVVGFCITVISRGVIVAEAAGSNSVGAAIDGENFIFAGLFPQAAGAVEVIADIADILFHLCNDPFYLMCQWPLAFGRAVLPGRLPGRKDHFAGQAIWCEIMFMNDDAFGIQR